MSSRRALALSLLLLVGGCAPGAPAAPTTAPPAEPAAAAPSVSPSPTSTPAALWPLRGTAAPSADAVRRRPIVVRIANDLTARPQSGLAAADMVWELLVEGGITRYMAVFHSTDADQVGPIRSARLSDLDYLPMLRGILAHVGGHPVVMQRVRSAAAAGHFVDVDEFFHTNAYQRVLSRPAPDNVYTSTKRIREEAGRLVRGGDPVDVPALRFAAAAPSRGTLAASLAVPYLGAMRVAYTYDASAGGYRRSQNDVATEDAATRQPVPAANVVIIHTDITPAGIVDGNGSSSLDFRTTGTGPATLFRDGQRVDGTWAREGTATYRFLDATGAELALKPGQTWVHVVPTSWTVESAP